MLKLPLKSMIIGNCQPVTTWNNWITLPAEIQMGSIFYEPGTYDIELTFYDHGNDVEFTDTFPNVIIRANRTTFMTYRTFK